MPICRFSGFFSVQVEFLLLYLAYNAVMINISIVDIASGVLKRVLNRLDITKVNRLNSITNETKLA